MNMNLEQYFQRINYQSDTQPTLATLNALTFAHATHIPFENISVLQKQMIAIDPASLFEKIVVQKRGGYCFEQNGLFFAVLQQLGFDVEPLAARVRLGETDRAVIPVRTHLMLKVTIDGKSYITDVGVGSSSLSQALQLKENTLQETSHDTRRFQRVNNQWYMQVLYSDTWQDVYQFGGEIMHESDRKVANWYTSTHPDSHFTQRLSVAIANQDGSRTTVSGNVLTVRQKNGDKQETILANNESLLAALRDNFGLKLDGDTRLLD